MTDYTTTTWGGYTLYQCNYGAFTTFDLDKMLAHLASDHDISNPTFSFYPPVVLDSAGDPGGEMQVDASNALYVNQSALDESTDSITAYVENTFSFKLLSVDAGEDSITTGAGQVHTLTFSCVDAAPSAAGLIVLYDNTSAAGTAIWSGYFGTTWFAPFTITLDADYSTGLYIDYGTANEIMITLTYR